MKICASHQTTRKYHKSRSMMWLGLHGTLPLSQTRINFLQDPSRFKRLSAPSLSRPYYLPLYLPKPSSSSDDHLVWTSTTSSTRTHRSSNQRSLVRSICQSSSKALRRRRSLYCCKRSMNQRTKPSSGTFCQPHKTSGISRSAGRY